MEKNKKNPIPKKVAIYIRVSTRDQTERYGPDLQRDAVMAMIKSRSAHEEEPLTFAGEEYVYMDDITGSSKLEERPDFNRMIEDINSATEGIKPFDVVAVYKIDRFARKLSVLLDAIDFFEEAAVQFISVSESIDTSTPFGRAMLNILGVIAELERDNIKDRTSAGRIAAIIHKGVHMGTHAKYGYIKDEQKTLKICKQEASVVEMIFDMFINQKKTVYQIADYLTDNRYLTPEASALKHKKYKGSRKMKGSKYEWYPETVRRILKDEIYTGRAYYGKTKDGKKVPKSEWMEYAVPSIIDDLTFSKAVKTAEEVGHKQKRTGGKHIYLLSGLLKCDTCKKHSRKHFIGTPKTVRKSGNRTHYYVCKGKSSIINKSVCSALPLPAEATEKYIVNLCKQTLKNPVHTFNYQKTLSSTKLRTKQIKREEEQIRKTLNEIPTTIERIRYQHERGLLGTEDLENKLQNLLKTEKEQKKKLEDVRAQLSKNSVDKIYAETFKLFSKKYQRMLESIDTKRGDIYKILHALIDEIIVYTRPVKDSDKVAGRKKKGQMITNRMHIKFNLPQEILNEIGKQDTYIKEIVKASGGSSSQKNISGGR